MALPLPAFAQGVGEFFGPRAREKNLRLETVIAPGLPRVVRGDAQRLRQVCYNLLGNAVKFTAQGSVIFTVERAGEQAQLRFDWPLLVICAIAACVLIWRLAASDKAESATTHAADAPREWPASGLEGGRVSV